jgi:hypothetical protein
VCVLFAPAVLVSVLCDGFAGAASVLYYCYRHYYLLLPSLLFVITHSEIAISTVVLVIDLAMKLTIQPPLLPGRLKEGCYLRPIVGAIDGE